MICSPYVGLLPEQLRGLDAKASLCHDRSIWGRGPWDGEPDRVEWTEGQFEVTCMRSGRGAWCAILGLPKGHPWYGQASPVKGAVHGGFTYAKAAGYDRESKPLGRWWLGFDCSHGGDLVPRDIPNFGRELEGDHCSTTVGTYRDLAFVVDQIRGLLRMAAGVLPS